MKSWISISRLLATLFLFISILTIFTSLTIGATAEAQTNLVNTDTEFAKGELAYAQKDYAGAESHFSTLVQRYPQSARAHYLLGATYYAQDKKDLAKTEFEKVKTLPESNEYNAKAQRYLDALAGKGGQPKSYVINLATGFRYDSNLYLDSESGVVISNQASPAWDVSIHGAYFPVQSEAFRMGLEYSFFNSLYGEHHGFNFMQHRAGGIFQWKGNDVVSLRFNPNFSAFFVESGEDFYSMTGQFPVTLRFDEGDAAATEISYRFEIEEFSNVTTNDFVITNSYLRDNLSHFPGIDQYFYFMERRGYFQVGVTVPIENAANPFDLIGPDMRARLAIPLPADFLAQLYAGYFMKYYFHDNLPAPGFTPDGIQRHDNQLRLGGALKKLLWNPLWASAGYEYLNNHSNEPTLSFDRHTVTFYVGADF